MLCDVYTCLLLLYFHRMPNLRRKNDFVVWCYLSELQQNIYRSFSEQDEIKEVIIVKNLYILVFPGTPNCR